MSLKVWLNVTILLAFWQDVKEVVESPRLFSFVVPGAKKQHPQAGGSIVQHDTPLKRGPVGGVYMPEAKRHTHTTVHTFGM